MMTEKYAMEDEVKCIKIRHGKVRKSEVRESKVRKQTQSAEQ